MRFYLVYGASEELEITGQCQIGRRTGDLKFNDELLSGLHAKFFSDGESLFVTDLVSSNGTYINKKKIEANVPHELNDGDLIDMGAQRIKVKKIDNERTRFEEPQAPGESTRIEISSISVLKDEVAAKVEEAAPILLKSEATHIESISDLTPAETYRAQAPIKVTSEHTHIEIESPAIQADIVEHTHIETAKEAAPAAVTHLKIVEAQPSNHIQPARILRDDSPKVSSSPQIHRTAGPAPNAQPHPIVAVANDMENVFGAKKIMIASAIIIGIFAYLLSGKKNVDRVIARAEEKKIEAPQSSSEPILEKPIAVEVASMSSQSISVAAMSAPSSETVKTESSEASASTESSISSNIVSEADAKPKSKAKVKSKKKAKVAKKTTTAVEPLKSTKKDPYAEAALLKKLSKIKEEAKRTKSQRVKAALEVDAVDLTAAHYKRFKTAILLKWKKSRGLASTEKNKLKKTLQGQIIALNNREKNVRAQITPYINGKIETPFK